MNQINNYIENFLEYVQHKNYCNNQNELIFIASNWDSEYNIITWLGSKKTEIITPETICNMIQYIQAYYGNDLCLFPVYLELTPDSVLQHYTYCYLNKKNY